MLRNVVFLILSFSVFLLFSCGGEKEGPSSEEVFAASMEQLHAENGQPVSVRKLATEDFSVCLKYPAMIKASSESTAYSALDDVVRTVSARVGTAVNQGDVIVSFSPDNRALQQAILAHENIRAAYERGSFLFKSNDISRQYFDTIRMQYEISQTTLKAANDMLYVKAPISGTITQINVRVTENVRPGTPLFTVSNSSAFEARLYVGVEEIEQIQAGARAFIELNRGTRAPQNVEGRVTQVSLAMDSQKQAFPVTVFFDGGTRRLASGMNVDIAVETYRNENAIVLSRHELIQTETGPVVFVVEENFDNSPRVQKVAVQTGVEKGLRLEISGGLNEGELIVSEGAHRIDADSKINIVPAILAAAH